jgi:hypothetical protein
MLCCPHKSAEEKDLGVHYSYRGKSVGGTTPEPRKNTIRVCFGFAWWRAHVCLSVGN